ncbi:hypothetical protein MXD61_04515, partial [Frankia sp. AgPm24]
MSASVVGVVMPADRDRPLAVVTVEGPPPPPRRGGGGPRPPGMGLSSTRALPVLSAAGARRGWRA